MAGGARIVIPRCIGCGAMYEPERCERGCHEQRLQLVAAGDLELAAAATCAALARIGLLLPALRALTEPLPADADWQRAYRVAAQAARAALHDTPPPAAPPPAALPPAAAPADGAWPAEGGEPLRIEVWRCCDCGAVDAPQECLGICIWRRFAWVAAADYEAASATAAAAHEHERRVRSLLHRLAYTTPRAGAWERSWRTLSREAGILTQGCAPAAEPVGIHV